MKNNPPSQFLTDFSSFGKVKVSGSDRESLLHNILTQDIKKISVNEHTPAALLTHTGKMLLFMEVYKFEDFFILVLENNLAAKAIPLIDKYIITEDVQLADVTEEYSFFWSFDPPFEKILTPKDKNGVSLNAQDSEIFRIAAGIPLYGVDMNENTILSETGLEEISVSETKGCYPGQEVVARIQTYKGLTKKLCRFLIEGNQSPQAGDKIYLRAAGEPKEIGWMTSAVYSPALKKIMALGYLVKDFFKEKTEIQILISGKWIHGTKV